MDTTTIVIIAIVVVVIAGGIVIAARLSILPAMRTQRLRKRFGPEYERTLREHGDRSAAEHDLSRRLSDREKTKLRELTEEERSAHVDAWAAVQQEFVDDPVSAVHRARGLTDAIMRDLGYPQSPSSAEGGPDDESFEERAKALSVDHPSAVARYRDTQAAGHLAEADRAETENLREALLAYRGLVDALLGGLPTDQGSQAARRSPKTD